MPAVAPEASPFLPVHAPMAIARNPWKIAITNMWKASAAMCIPPRSTSRTAGEKTPIAQRTSAPTAVRPTIELALEKRTLVRLFGLPKRSPIVPLRSSPAIEAEPIDSERAARVSAPASATSQ